MHVLSLYLIAFFREIANQSLLSLAAFIEQDPISHTSPVLTRLVVTV